MSAKIIHLTQRRPKANNLPESSEAGPEPVEAKSDKIAVFVLHHNGEASAWVSEGIQTRQEWNLVLDFLDKLRDSLAHVREEFD